MVWYGMVGRGNGGSAIPPGGHSLSPRRAPDSGCAGPIRLIASTSFFLALAVLFMVIITIGLYSIVLADGYMVVQGIQDEEYKVQGV